MEDLGGRGSPDPDGISVFFENAKHVTSSEHEARMTLRAIDMAEQRSNMASD
jgi:hypothetical protein